MARRAIFEDVPDRGPSRRPAAGATGGGLIDQGGGGARRAIRAWLILLFVLVAAMIAVGGMTRLTDSGLSITEWRPVTGALPPLSAADWQAEFDKYQATPQYRLMNRGMSLEEFKVIYWWEWGHRQLGRLIGLVWAAGFLGFLAARHIPPGWTGRLLLVGALGGLQGAIGWWMVASGLAGERTAVASYRLALHLGLAFVILGLIADQAMGLARREADLLEARRRREGRLVGLATGIMHLGFLQILLGALVAGIDAGRSYIDWPLMHGVFLPPESLDLVPWWRNLFENPALVQFLHRMGGYLLVLLAILAAVRGRASPHPATRAAFGTVLALALAQAAVGILTVMAGAPWPLGILHQGTAIALWVGILHARHLAGQPRAATIRARR
ncbi:MAG: COX15/CtaA family protein [Rhodobacteraceae bacterium]|nr:COX15/CtaA family protein [Paracoccaceae bacterium]